MMKLSLINLQFEQFVFCYVFGCRYQLWAEQSIFRRSRGRGRRKLQKRCHRWSLKYEKSFCDLALRLLLQFIRTITQLDSIIPRQIHTPIWNQKLFSEEKAHEKLPSRRRLKLLFTLMSRQARFIRCFAHFYYSPAALRFDCKQWEIPRVIAVGVNSV